MDRRPGLAPERQRGADGAPVEALPKKRCYFESGAPIIPTYEGRTYFLYIFDATSTRNLECNVKADQGSSIYDITDTGGECSIFQGPPGARQMSYSLELQQSGILNLRLFCDKECHGCALSGNLELMQCATVGNFSVAIGIKNLGSFGGYKSSTQVAPCEGVLANQEPAFELAPGGDGPCSF